VREVLKEAGDAVVLAPEDAREAVRAEVERLRDSYAAPPPGSSVGAPKKPSRSAPRRKRASTVTKRQPSGDGVLGVGAGRIAR
jgi:hypothetical protein